MQNTNVLVTGTPRSGTTLTCHLLNKLSDTVALHEPMSVGKFAELQNEEERLQSIRRFFAEQRRSIHEHRLAISKNVGGAVPDNPVGVDRTAKGFRHSIVSKDSIVIDKELSQDFMLVIKHNSAFTAMLEGLAEGFQVYAVVRNPLATLASWSSVKFPVRRGHARAAEKLDPTLAAKLGSIENDLDRQIFLLDWFHSQFRQHLPERSIIRYESVVESGGRVLRIVRSEAETLSEPLESRNLSALYDHRTMRRIGERLLASEGAYWEWYAKESVAAILDDLAEGTGEAPNVEVHG